MKRSTKIHKIANIIFGLLMSVPYTANAMDGKEEGSELTARIRAEVARVLETFERNMNDYYARTGNPKRVSIADEGLERQHKEEGSEGETAPIMPLLTTGGGQLLTPSLEEKPGTEAEAANNTIRDAEQPKTEAEKKKAEKDAAVAQAQAVRNEIDGELSGWTREFLAEKATYILFEIADGYRDHPALRIAYLVQKGADVNAVDENVGYPGTPIGSDACLGYQPLHYAASYSKDNKAEAIRALRYFGADANAPERHTPHETPLHIAARKGHVAAIKTLCKPLTDSWGRLLISADANARNPHGYTPMHHAAKEGHVEAIKTLHGLGADINAKDDGGHTPLFLAALSKHKEAVDALLELGADVNAKDNKSGDTVLRALETYARDDTANKLIYEEII